MNKSKFLLPVGFRDQLFDEAEAEYFAINSFVQYFMSKNYRLVSTPLVEFEDSLFYGAGKALEAKTLKMFDPISQKVMGIRSDITTQIARLFLARMVDYKLPLRLCYFGDILRSQATNTRGDRQLKQVGIELIDTIIKPQNDAEIVLIAAESLIKAGIKDITIDLNTPNLVSNISAEQKKLIEKRDIKNLPPDIANFINASGNAEVAFSKIKANEQIAYVQNVFEEIKKAKMPINLTIDFVENRGLEYHSLFAFSIFALGIKDELGKGGRYAIDSSNSATGVTLYINSFLEKTNLPKSY